MPRPARPPARPASAAARGLGYRGALVPCNVADVPRCVDRQLDYRHVQPPSLATVAVLVDFPWSEKRRADTRRRKPGTARRAADRYKRSAVLAINSRMARVNRRRVSGPEKNNANASA